MRCQSLLLRFMLIFLVAEGVFFGLHKVLKVHDVFEGAHIHGM